MNSSNFSDTQKTRLRRGYYFLHKNSLEESKLQNFTDADKRFYLDQANKADKKDKRDSDIGWFFGIIFYGGIGLWILSSITSGTTSSGSNNTSNTSTPSSNYTSSEDSYEPATYDEPEPEPEAEEDECDPGYSGCVPNVSYDLDCADIQEEVEVYGSDYHGFDRDGDGYGCESYN
jgi:hypothetical protein